MESRNLTTSAIKMAVVLCLGGAVGFGVTQAAFAGCFDCLKIKDCPQDCTVTDSQCPKKCNVGSQSTCTCENLVGICKCIEQVGPT